MANRIFCTLNPHAVNSKLSLSQGNLVVTANDVCDIQRSVFGTLPEASGQLAFECQVWSLSRPAAGLANLVSVGVGTIASSTAKFAGQEATSWGLRPTEGQVWNNNASISGAASPALQPIPERVVIGVFLDNTATPPICVWHINGNPIFQANLTAGVFYVPQISIGANAPGDVSAFCNFGQRLLNFPIMSVTK